QEVCWGTQTGARDNQFPVIRSEAFGNPQAGRVDLVLIIEWAQLDRPQPFDVEGMEIFVADKPQPRHVSIAALRRRRVGGNKRGVLMFETAASLPEDHEEYVPFEREKTPHAPVLADNLLDLAGCLPAVPAGVVASVHQEVLAPIDLE